MKPLSPLLALSLFLSSTVHATDEQTTASVTQPSALNEQLIQDVVDQDQVIGDQIVFDDPRDPLESFNRAIFHFNYYYLDAYVLRPVAVGYRDYVPNFAKTGMMNFLENLDEPSSLVNNTLQGKWGWAANAGGRFIVNTTVGIGGLIDVASHLGMEKKQDDFSEVLGHYGVGNGPYLMLPGMGPTVLREISSDWVDDLYFPLSELTLTQSIASRVLKGIDVRAQLLDQDKLMENALDPYTFVKDGYLQRVDFKVYDGDIPLSDDEDELFDEYLDELE